MALSTDVVNEALGLLGDNTPAVTGSSPNFDSSAAGIAASRLYAPTVANVMRQFAWDFSRNTITLTSTGNTPPFPWSFEYAYPANAVQIWQIAPASLADHNNPKPTTWAVANNLVAAVQTKVIQTNQAAALAVYSNMPLESTWDPLFRAAVVRLLASGLAMALAGRPDSMAALLESGASFETLGESRDS